MGAPRTRADLAGIPTYRPGRAGAAAAATDVLAALASNENPYPPLPSVAAAVAQAAQHVNRYPEMTSATLGHALAAHLEVPAADVVLGPGSVGVLQALTIAMARSGDEVVFAWRSFEAYPIVVQVTGATPVPVPLAPDGTHDVERLVDAVTPRTRMLLVCSPNNPTGPVVSDEHLRWLLDVVPQDVLVVLDEAYVEFVRDAQAADGLAAYRNHENVAVLRTFSKAYGLAGLRVGYGVTHEPVTTGLRATSLPFGVGSPAQAAAMASLRHTDELDERVSAVVAERSRVRVALADIGWDVPSSEGNFVWLEARDSTAGLAARCREAGVAVRVFHGEGVRVTIGTSAENDRLLEAVAQEPRTR